MRMGISVLVASAILASAGFCLAQQREASFAVAVRPSSGAQSGSSNLPSSPIMPITNPILPITNPIAPMTNPISPITSPVQPIIPIPFIRDPGTRNATVVVPSPADGSRAGRNSRGPQSEERRPDRGHQRVVPIPVIILPYPYTAEPVDLIPRSPIPGQLRGANPGRAAPGDTPVFSDVTEVLDSPDVPADVAEPAIPEPQIINVREPVGPRLPPPALGMGRAELLSRYGNPWGTVLARDLETLYFEGDLVVVLQDGIVVRVR